MFGKVMDFIDKPFKDEIYENLNKNNKFRVTKEWFGLCFVLIVLIYIIVFMFYIKNKDYEPPVVYQVTAKTLENNTYKKPLIALNMPRATKSSLQNWAIKATNNIYNFNFNNFDKQLEKSSHYFTDAGWYSFLMSIENSGLRDTIEDNKQMLKLTASEEPVIKHLSGSTDKITGKKFWRIEVPAILTTTSGKTVYKRLSLNMNVVLEDTNNGSAGFFINDMMMVLK